MAGKVIAGGLVMAALLVAVAHAQAPSATAPEPSPARPRSASLSSGAVGVSASVNHAVSCVRVDATHLAITSNAPWKVTLVLPSGAKRVKRGDRQPTVRMITIPAGASFAATTGR